jgi:hypothetical protein
MKKKTAFLDTVIEELNDDLSMVIAGLWQYAKRHQDSLSIDDCCTHTTLCHMGYTHGFDGLVQKVFF